MTPWTIPGYDVTGRLGAERRVDVWSAIEQATGEVVVLRRVTGGRPAAAELVRMASAVASLRTEHLIRLRATVTVDDGDVLVLDHAEHGALADLLTRRSGFTAGEVVTVIAPLASAVAEAHARGLMHGRIDATTVLIGRGGRPMLDGLGLGALYDGPEVEGPAGDVRALADLATDLLAGDSSPEAERVRSALSATTAAELAERVLTACPAAPIQGLAVAPAVASSSLDDGRGFRRTGAVVVVLGLITGLAVVRGQQAPEPDWRRVVVALDEARARAFAEVDARLLEEVYVAGSPPAVADQVRLAALRRQGHSASGVQHQIEVVTPVRSSADEVELRVKEQLKAHQVQDSSGRVVARTPAGERGTDVLVLVSTRNGWRVQAIR